MNARTTAKTTTSSKTAPKSKTDTKTESAPMPETKSPETHQVHDLYKDMTESIIAGGIQSLPADFFPKTTRSGTGKGVNEDLLKLRTAFGTAIGEMIRTKEEGYRMINAKGKYVTKAVTQARKAANDDHNAGLVVVVSHSSNPQVGVQYLGKDANLSDEEMYCIIFKPKEKKVFSKKSEKAEEKSNTTTE